VLFYYLHMLDVRLSHLILVSAIHST